MARSNGKDEVTRADHPVLARANACESALRGCLPSISHDLGWPGVFQSLRVGISRDGTYWAVLKKSGDGGRTVVAFGNGYDPFLALAALEGAVNAGKFSAEKPYKGS